MTLAPGTHVGPYEILGTLGSGGMGEVYRARDPRLGRDVAIKVVRSTDAGDTDRLRRLELEARTAGRLNHPNILAVYDVGTHDQAPYFVTELLHGESLRHQLTAGALPVRKATEFAVQIGRGLAAAHEKGIVHRDLKPENVFVTREGALKILDFGLAKLRDPSDATLETSASADSKLGSVFGTLAYMSPEQLRAQRVDHRSDIFSFGALLYEMATGRPAFQGASTADTISAILQEEPTDSSRVLPSISPMLTRVVRRCLEKNPDDRFQSTKDVIFALEAVAGTLDSNPVTPEPSRGGSGRRVIANRQGLAWITMGLLVAAAASLGYLAWQGRGNSAVGRTTLRIGTPPTATVSYQLARGLKQIVDETSPTIDAKLIRVRGEHRNGKTD